MIKIKIVWSNESIKKVDIIYSHITKNFNKNAADKFYHDLIAFIDHLKKFPRIGKLSTKFWGIHEYHIDGNTVYYRIISDSKILIVTIHPRKNK